MAILLRKLRQPLHSPVLYLSEVTMKAAVAILINIFYQDNNVFEYGICHFASHPTAKCFIEIYYHNNVQ